MARSKHIPSSREQAFLDTVESPRYERESINGLRPFFDEKMPENMRGFYTEEELKVLKSLKGTDRDVEARMPVKMTTHYFEMGRKSEAIRRLVKADAGETNNLEGSEDPGNQMDYSPVEGLIHK